MYGIKIEEQANRDTFFWVSPIKAYKVKKLFQLEEFWRSVQSVAREEDKDRIARINLSAKKKIRKRCKISMLN